MLRLIIGNRNYSSWSLRAWLYLTVSGIEFEEIRIPLFTDGDWRRAVARYTPAGRVPVLVDGDLHVWDSLAIIEHLREQHRAALDWPAPAAARARARSIACEMHSGFLAVRDELPQNIRRREPLPATRLSDACAAQIARIDDLWCRARADYGAEGPWLFGALSIADILYAPVALRFLSYGIALSDVAAEYVRAVDTLPAIRRWVVAAAAETEHIDFIDRLVPAADSPLLLG